MTEQPSTGRERSAEIETASRIRYCSSCGCKTEHRVATDHEAEQTSVNCKVCGNDPEEIGRFGGREPLAFAYEADELVAKLYKRKAVRECRDAGWLKVVLTPLGEKKMRVETDGGVDQPDSEQIETWSRGWPGDDPGVVYYARCPDCTQTHRSGDRQQAVDGAKACCDEPQLMTDGGPEQAESDRETAVQSIPEAETHIDQSPPYEWSAMEHDGETYIVRDVPEGAAGLYVVRDATRIVRLFATTTHALYEGNVVRSYYDDDFRGVEFIHDFAGRLGCHAVEDVLDDPAIRLKKIRSGSGDLSEVVR